MGQTGRRYREGVTASQALLVEDPPELVHICQRMLENEGFEVLVAPDGEKGVALARALHWSHPVTVAA